MQQALLLACFFLAEASELDVISPLTSAWRLLWALDTNAAAFLASVGFAGFALGTSCSGVVGDRFGRRVPILAGYVGVLIGALGMWSAATPEVVGFFRAMAGFSVGLGVPAALTMAAEIAPAKSRGQMVNFCYVAIGMGALYADLGLYFFLPDLRSGDWRSLVLWSALPALGALPLGWCSLEDTPSFHAMSGDDASLARVLNKMSSVNGRPDVAWKGSPPTAVSTVGLLPTPETRPLQVLAASAIPLAGCAALDFAYNFVGFGLGYFFPLLLSELTESTPLPPVGELVVTNLIAFPGIMLAYAAVQSDVGNKEVLLICGLIEMAAVVCLLAGSPGSAAALAGIVALKLAMPTFSQTTNVVKGEAFPVRARVTALSISGTCGRMGALIAPAIIEETRGEPASADEFSVFLTCLIAVLGVAVLALVVAVPETKGSRLPE